MGQLDALYQDLINQGINNVKIIAIGREQYNASNSNWTAGNTIPVLVDPSPYNTWSSWGAAQRDLFFFDVDGSYHTDFNITSWNYNTIYNTIITLLPECANAIGDMNGDGVYNVQDIVVLANCVLAEKCDDTDAYPNGCSGDINADGNYDVLDIVLLANCVLAENCS